MTVCRFLFLATLAAAAAPTRCEERAKFTGGVDLVLLEVSVRDGSGYVAGLTESNFRVWDNGEPQKISFFGQTDEPVTVGIVVDNSGSMRLKRNEIVLAALSFARASNPLDELFVVNFDDRARLGLEDERPFTSDPGALQQALTSRPTMGKTALYDAILLGLQQLERGKHERKALLVLSDGGDNASAADLTDVVRRAQSSSAVIYTIGLFDPTDPDANPGVLRRLARETGGESYSPGVLSKIRAVCESIAQDIRARYTIGYTPTLETETGRPYHRVRVAVEAPDRGRLSVRSRPGYIRPAPPGPAEVP